MPHERFQAHVHGAVFFQEVWLPVQERARVVVVVRPLPGAIPHQRLAHPRGHVALTSHRVRRLGPEGVGPRLDGGVIHAAPDGAEKVQRLLGVRRHQRLHGVTRDIVVFVHGVHHVCNFVPGGRPVVLLHASVAQQGRVQRAQVVTRDDDWHSAQLVVLAVLGQVAVFLARHTVWVVAQVHQRAHHHLAVDGGLRLFEAPRPRVDVIHDKTAHLALVPNNLRRLAVAAAQQAPGLTRPLVLQLPRRHDHREDVERLARQLQVEGLAAPLGAPDAKDERHTGVAQGPMVGARVGAVHQQVLGDVQRHAVQELRGHVEVAHDVGEGARVVEPQLA
mmetsp:Transcript_5896/g.14618  ORF Transcript_5896/g.14618 Transcript_5896/m.14618 type:complete len:333 (+) Transcript_5896:620-1618(+)